MELKPNDSKTDWTIGVISDTHGLLRPEALAALQGTDYIIHAGDIGEPAILAQLGAIAPGPDEITCNTINAGIYVLHNLNQLDLNPKAAGFTAVVSGHTHQPKQEMRDGVLYFNPGSAGPRRFKLPVTVGRLRIQGMRIESEVIDLKI